MELRHLRYFIAVAEEGSFTKAAQRLFISQPPLTKQIKNLEEELGVMLFDRSTRYVSLTPAGRAFLGKAKNTIYESEAAIRAAQRSDAGFGEVITIGFMSAVMLQELVPTLSTAHKSSPSIDFRFQQMRSDEQLQAVIDERIDIGCVDLGIAEIESHIQKNHLIAWPFFTDTLVVALAKTHPLAGVRNLRLKDMKDERFAILERHLYPSHFDTVIQACDKEGFKPKIFHYANQIPEVLTYVAAGIAVGIAPAVAAKSWSSQVCFIPLKEKPTIGIHMIARQSHMSPGVTLIQKVTEESRAQSNHHSTD